MFSAYTVYLNSKQFRQYDRKEIFIVSILNGANRLRHYIFYLANNLLLKIALFLVAIAAVLIFLELSLFE